MTHALNPIECPPVVSGWLKQAVASDASDVHVVAGSPPMLRVHGKLTSLNESPLDADSIRALL